MGRLIGFIGSFIFCLIILGIMRMILSDDYGVFYFCICLFLLIFGVLVMVGCLRSLINESEVENNKKTKSTTYVKAKQQEEIDNDKTYWEDLDLLAEIEKLETKEAVGVFDYPFYKQFQEDVFYETKNPFPKTKEDLEEKGYFDIREERGYKHKDWIEELKCFKVILFGFKKVGKYKVRVDFDITRNRIYPIYASDEETKKPSPRVYYFEELREKIDEICSLANVTTNKDGLKYYSFGRMMSPDINIRFKEYWKAPQTRKDFQKLGCTSIEYSDKVWTCYKQIGNKILSLYFNKEYNHNYIFSIREIDLIQHEEQPKQVGNEYKQSSVYLLFNPLNNTYKIGKANDVNKRLRTFQTGTPDIQLITYKTYASEKQAYQMETMLHRQYKDNNYKKEWFNLNEEDVEFIKQTLS